MLSGDLELERHLATGGDGGELTKELSEISLVFLGEDVAHLKFMGERLFKTREEVEHESIEESLFGSNDYLTIKDRKRLGTEESDVNLLVDDLED